MNKNYYEILQIDKNASPEIIEKAYKTLAKKYHPDLQTGENKKQAEEILKQINEAYDVLSDPEKKEHYDASLVNNSISEEKFNEIYQENQMLKNKITHMQQTKQANPNPVRNQPASNISHKNQNTYEQELQNARKQAYRDAYIQDLKNRGYKIRYKKSFKDYLKSFFSLLLTALILLLLWQIPLIRNFFMNLYNQNIVIKSLVSIIRNLF